MQITLVLRASGLGPQFVERAALRSLFQALHSAVEQTLLNLVVSNFELCQVYKTDHSASFQPPMGNYFNKYLEGIKCIQ